MTYRYTPYRPRQRRSCRLCGRQSSYASRGADVGDIDLCDACVQRAYGRRGLENQEPAANLELRSLGGRLI